MADATTALVAAGGVVGVTTASLVPGVDANAVIGAFAGALFFIVWKADLSAWKRLGYFVASWILGYYFAAEVVGQSWAKTSGVVAFGGALFTVVVCVSLLEWVEGGKLPGWLGYVIGVVRAAFGASGGRNG
ncbi:putative holin [Pseudomonas sp. SG20056]|uniref:putative holin n=1 Tax=Pseudomonas sp. SG20056 TaxID=3074146 RepID=UPI00287FB01E|nr:putative holin [Pseudomonas sp. SG20056]WNF45829.1 putative holin [Pseudomonas sp. SG20056]